MPETVGVIPARYGAARFPGKVLALLAGKPMLQQVWERARAARCLDRVLIAADDERIRAAAAGFGAEVVMTDPELPSGTDRVWQAARQTGAEVIVNIQGDEPLLHPEAIDALVEALAARPRAQMATLKFPSHDEAGYRNPNVVKVETDLEGWALYFSRAAIPSTKKPGQLPSVWYKHIGLYAYRRDFLEAFVGWPVSALEQAEKLEQLRALEHGARIFVLETGSDTVGVDTPEDLQRVEQILEEQRAKERSAQ